MPRASKKPKYETKPSPANNVAGLLKELWEAAVNLRGSIEPADYKRYVLPIIFLRFLSLRYERRRAELIRLIAEPASEYYQYPLALFGPDEYRAGCAFILPEEARWDSIRRMAQTDDVKVRLDNILELLEKTYPEQLRGLLPRIYAGSNLDPSNLAGLINLFSKDIFSQEYAAEDLLGRIYEYFIGELASSEGKRGGEYFTPSSIVRLLVAMLEPAEGKVFDPCCGSGGMFVQSDLFTKHSGRLSFFGQESKDFTYRLCRMNLSIHGIVGNIQLGNSYHDDKQATLRANYILANPPFNDGAKSEAGWGADKIPGKDPRLSVDGQPMALSPRNANTMWTLHFLHHLADGGTAGFVMATGELSNSETARHQVRRALVEQGYVDCIVQLSGQLFANTQIPCTLWFLSKNRDGKAGFRKRRDGILFVDARNLGSLMPGSRKQKQLSPEEIERVATVYRQFRRSGPPEVVPGFCQVATIERVREHGYVLSPGRYVGATEEEDDGEPFDEKIARLAAQWREQSAQAHALDAAIDRSLKEMGYGLLEE